MRRTIQVALVGAGLNGLMAVIAGALGAHALQLGGSALAERLMSTGSTYQLAHAAALVGIAAMARNATSGALGIAALCFAFGAFLFGGSLYLAALLAPSRIGVLAPAGGLLMILGWLSTFVAAFTYRRGATETAARGEGR